VETLLCQCKNSLQNYDFPSSRDNKINIMRIFTLYWREFTQFEDSSGLSREVLVAKHCVKPLIGYTYVYVIKY